MKRTVFITTLALAASAFVAFTQEPTASPSPTTSPTAKWHGRGGRMFEIWKSLTPEEQAKVKSARKTTKTNPQVEQAKSKMLEAVKEYREIRQAEMLKTDPSLAPILEKFKAAKEEKKRQQ